MILRPTVPALMWILAFALLTSSPRAYAWGAEGHRVIAQIAADGLTPAARRQVSELLGGSDAKDAMVEVSTWADEIRRSRPNTAPWHYVDIPLGSRGYEPARDCPRDKCVVAQIEQTENMVSNRSLSAGERDEALRFLIHFVADVHQPLHAIDDHDRGGNRVRVVAGRRHTNLHAVWDVDVVRAVNRNPVIATSILEAEITPDKRAVWLSGDAASWANESYALARREIYPSIPRDKREIPLPRNYAQQEEAVAAVQMEKAGVRLASLLNRLLR